MRNQRTGLLTRALVAVFTCAVLVAPLVGIAHAAEHHTAAESVDCGTCHWSKNVAGTVIEAPTLAVVATVEVACVAGSTEPDLRFWASDFHTRGPPAARV